jgi:hypothetical protein
MAERWRQWIVGLLFGALITVAFMLGGVRLLVVSVGLLGVASAVSRSFAVVSGGLIGAGAIYAALMVRADLACRAFDAGPNQACEPSDLAPYLAQAGVAVLLGVAAAFLGLWHRRSSRA